MSFDKRKLKDSITDESDRLFMSQMIDKQLFSRENNCFSFSDFMDPYRRSLCLSHLCKMGQGTAQTVLFYGGYDEAERVIAIFLPDNNDSFYQITVLPLSCLKITCSGKNTLSHRDYLGALTGLGITRDKFGDIVVSPDMKNTAFVVVKSEIADYVCQNFRQAGKARAECSICDFDELFKNLTQPREYSINVASMRVDNILASAFNLVRSEAKSLISRKKVFINWRLCTSPDKKVAEGDTITLRGKGRVRIGEIKSTTRKNRIVMGVYK